MLLICNDAGNVHRFLSIFFFFAPSLAKVHQHLMCIYMGLTLFSHVHLAEFNFPPLPLVAEFLSDHRFLFLSLSEAKKMQ